MTRHKLANAIQSVYGDLPKPNGITTLALIKGDERYVFLFSDDKKAEVLRVIGRFACNPELSFSWMDAAVLSQKVRADGGYNGK